MTTKRDWLKRILKRVVRRIVRIGEQVRGISLSPRRRNFPKWFFGVKFIVCLLALALILLLILCGVAYVVCDSIFSGNVVFDNRRVEAVRIHQVAVDGHRVSLHKRRGVVQSFELSKEIKILDPESMRPNATHRITVIASSASVPEAKKYTCVIFIPPQWGDVWVYFEDRESVRCKFWEFKGY